MEDTSLKDIVSWTEDGKAFTIYDVQKFTDEVMPLHFSRYLSRYNFVSFVRQLNNYVSHPSRGLPTRIYRGFNHHRLVWIYITVPVIARGRGWPSIAHPARVHPTLPVRMSSPTFLQHWRGPKMFKKIDFTS
jgi:hypothetical protein